MKAMIHVTKECNDIEDAADWYNDIKEVLSERQNVHVNGQVTIKFLPSHPEGTPEEGPIP